MGCGPTLYLFKHYVDFSPFCQRWLKGWFFGKTRRSPKPGKPTTPLPTQRVFQGLQVCKHHKTCQHTWKSIGKYIPMLFGQLWAGWFLAGSFQIDFQLQKSRKNHGSGRSHLLAFLSGWGNFSGPTWMSQEVRING